MIPLAGTWGGKVGIFVDSSKSVPYDPSMNRRILVLGGLSFWTINLAVAKDDVPRGYDPISELEKVRSEAVAKKKLVAVVVKGMDDNCPYCASALANGEKAIGSNVVKVFARAEDLNKADRNGFPSGLQERVGRKFTTGASVTVLVFNPDMTQLLAEASRRELESDRKSISNFQKQVSEQKKLLR